MSNDVHVTVAGWVAKKPELRVANDKSEWTGLRGAPTPRRRKPDGQWVDGKTEWFEVKAWGELAQNITKSLDTGHPVVVSGRLTTEQWQTAEGHERSSLVIHAQAIGHDLTRGRSSFVRVRHESSGEGSPVDVTGAIEVPDQLPVSAPSPEESGEASMPALASA